MVELEYSEIDNINIREQLLEHGLLVIRNADISMDEFKERVTSMGKPLVTTKHVLDDDRVVQELSENGLFSNKDVDWHNDWSYGRGNYFGTALRNVEGGELSETHFCDMTKIPQTIMRMYEGKVGKYYPPQSLHDVCFTEKQLRILEKQKVERPLVMDHPITGTPLVFCSPGTIQNDDIDLVPIILYADVAAYHYKHRWQPNDILIWDNYRMMHRRMAFEGHRLLWRIQFTLE